jgi:hypothetical protein
LTYSTVDLKLGCGESNGQVEGNIGSPRDWKAWYARFADGMQILLKERESRSFGGRSRIYDSCSNITEDGRVDSIGETSSTAISHSPDPIVANRLVSVKDERISLSGDCA